MCKRNYLLRKIAMPKIFDGESLFLKFSTDIEISFAITFKNVGPIFPNLVLKVKIR